MASDLGKLIWDEHREACNHLEKMEEYLHKMNLTEDERDSLIGLLNHAYGVVLDIAARARIYENAK